jgi:hypothetical protein
MDSQIEHPLRAELVARGIIDELSAAAARHEVMITISISPYLADEEEEPREGDAT